LVATASTKPCRIAAEELLADKVKWEKTPLRLIEDPDSKTGAA
jgi:hypothetical protein